MKKTLLFLLFALFTVICFSQQLVYKPVNPSFGGETFNYQWMLSSATAQNGFTDPNTQQNEEVDDLEQFRDNLERQLLSRISREVFNNQFDSDALEPGTTTIGGLEVEISEGVNGLIINILDTSTGEQTQIIVPN
ncbi:MAG: curli production assembly/transport component CsgF [Patiriisocius sp.]|uniref:curli production assembly/transport component CsgF n=1 Tax=Patiriisocius sp. TaxID=2822396 RepID=UPI003EF7FF2B